VLLDKTAPTLTITGPATALSGTPSLSGTADAVDLPPGSSLTVTVDADNNAATANNVVYAVVVAVGGTWSLDLSTATPTSSSLPNGGLVRQRDVLLVHEQQRRSADMCRHQRVRDEQRRLRQRDVLQVHEQQRCSADVRRHRRVHADHRQLRARLLEHERRVHVLVRRRLHAER
jgi:hypothetical protein